MSIPSIPFKIKKQLYIELECVEPENAVGINLDLAD